MRLLWEILKTEKTAKLCDFICIAYDKVPTQGCMLDIHVNDIEDEGEVLMRPGDIIMLPRNQKVINSLKHGVLNYFTTTRMGDDPPPLSLYSMKHIDLRD